MDKSCNQSRRDVLKRVGSTAVAGSVLANTAVENASAADRRYMSITETNGVEVTYTFELTTFRTPFFDKDLRGEGDLESDDQLKTSSGDALGKVDNGTDTYSFKGQLNSFELAAGPGAEVNVNFWGWEGYSDVNGVKISSDGEDLYSDTGDRSRTQFDASGNVSWAGDGTTEQNDEVGDQYAISYTRESGEDHFNFDGMPTFINIRPRGDFTMFNRYIASTW